MTISPIPAVEVPKDTFGENLANARKAVGAGVAAAFAAAIPVFLKSFSDGAINADEAGLIASAFVGALVSVSYVTWQTVNKPKPSDVANLQNALTAVPPIVVQAPEGALNPEYVGLPPLPDEPADEDVFDADEDYKPKHSA